jgi:hypothetical protein
MMLRDALSPPLAAEPTGKKIRTLSSLRCVSPRALRGQAFERLGARGLTAARFFPRICQAPLSSSPLHADLLTL